MAWAISKLKLKFVANFPLPLAFGWSLWENVRSFHGSFCFPRIFLNGVNKGLNYLLSSFFFSLQKRSSVEVSCVEVWRAQFGKIVRKERCWVAAFGKKQTSHFSRAAARMFWNVERIVGWLKSPSCVRLLHIKSAISTRSRLKLMVLQAAGDSFTWCVIFLWQNEQRLFAVLFCKTHK